MLITCTRSVLRRNGLFVILLCQLGHDEFLFEHSSHSLPTYPDAFSEELFRPGYQLPLVLRDMTPDLLQSLTTNQREPNCPRLPFELFQHTEQHLLSAARSLFLPEGADLKAQCSSKHDHIRGVGTG